MTLPDYRKQASDALRVAANRTYEIAKMTLAERSKAMTLPPLPDSPYLYTEWSSPAERVSNTMFTEAQMREYGKQCREAALEEAAKACDAIGIDQRALYKGRAPYFGTEPGRADPHVDGKSDGAWECEEAIRKLK